MSELHKKLLSEVSNKLASHIDNSVTISSCLRDEITSLKESVKIYEQTQSNLKQDIITAVGDAVSRENNTLLARRVRLDKLTEDLYRRLESGVSVKKTENTQNSQRSSRIEQTVEVS
jgi:lipopolysaccharide assembly outer membrane protein LptD (OstA)